MATDDTLAEVRDELARLRALDEAGTPGPWYANEMNEDIDGCYIRWRTLSASPRRFADPLPDDDYELAAEARDALPALLDLADAVARLAERGKACGWPWWREEDGPYCLFCGKCVDAWGMRGYPSEDHADDCPALALDAALRRLAGEAGDEGD